VLGSSTEQMSSSRVNDRQRRQSSTLPVAGDRHQCSTQLQAVSMWKVLVAAHSR